MRIGRKNVFKQRGFAGTEEAGKQGDGKQLFFGGALSYHSELRNDDTSVGVDSVAYDVSLVALVG